MEMEDKAHYENAATHCMLVLRSLPMSQALTRAPSPRRYGVVVLDEAHIRSLDTDVLIGLARQLLDRRDRDAPKLVIMSATLNAGRFADFFGGKIFRIPGRMCVRASHHPRCTGCARLQLVNWRTPSHQLLHHHARL
jgi:hypothetical protein